MIIFLFRFLSLRKDILKFWFRDFKLQSIDPKDHARYYEHRHPRKELHGREILAGRDCVLKILTQLIIHFQS